MKLDDDLEIDIPESDVNATDIPTNGILFNIFFEYFIGKDFIVVMEILKEYDEKLQDKSSIEFAILRKKIQKWVFYILFSFMTLDS